MAINTSSERKLFWYAFISFTIWSGIIFFSNHYLPMVDLPQHASQISIWMNMNNSDYPFSNLFEYNWFTPYLVGYSIIRVLTFLMPVHMAIKIVIFIASIAFVYACCLLLDIHSKIQWAALLAFPLIFNFNFYWGFVNYIVAIPIGLFFIVIAKNFIRDLTPRKGFILFLLSILLFFAHVLIYLYCMFLIFLMHLIYFRGWKQTGRLILTFLPSFIITILWYLYQIKYTPQVTLHPQFLYGLFRLIKYPSILLGSMHKQLIQQIVITILLFITPLIAFKKIQGRLSALFIATLFFYFFLPHQAFGTYFLYQRFAIFIFPFYLLSIQSEYKNSRHKLLQIICILLINVYWLHQTDKQFTLFNYEAGYYTQIEKEIPSHKRVLSMIYLSDSIFLDHGPYFLHFPTWYASNRSGVVDFSFAYFFPELIHYKKGLYPKADPYFVWHPNIFKWEDHSFYDYYVLKLPYGHEAMTEFPYPNDNKLVLVKNIENAWYLFKRIENEEE